MEKKKSWDDIPTLNGLSMDWAYKPENPLGKRSFVRMQKKELADLFEVQEIPVKIATSTGTFSGKLLDISQGGMGLSLSTMLNENVPLKVGLFLGKEKIISKAMVKWARKKGGGYVAGVMFDGLVKESSQYIAGIYASKILRHSL